jgi:multidrug efflux system membrane fusion protein
MNSPLKERKSFRRRNTDTLLTSGLAIFLLAFISFCAIGCHSKEDKKSDPAGIQAHPVLVAKAELKNVPLQLTSVGNVEAYATVQIKPRVGGVVTSVYFKEGDDVAEGDLLFKIDTRPFEIALNLAQSGLERDRALLKNAEEEVRRYEKLAQESFITKEKYTQLLTNYASLKGTVAADEAALAQAQLNLEYCTILSPVSGRTGSLMVDPGNLVVADDITPLVVITVTSPVYVSFSITEKYLFSVRKYMKGSTLRTEALVEEGGNKVSGGLAFVDSSVDRETGTILLKSIFPNKDRSLWPGQFTNVILTLTVEKDKVVVPNQAVQNGQNGTFVMVVKKDLTVEFRPVTVQRTYEGNSVIESGLESGETVVTDGQLRLVPGSRVEIKKSL